MLKTLLFLGTALTLSALSSAQAQTQIMPLIAPDQSILPPTALANAPIPVAAHPLAPQLNNFFTAQAKVEGFQASGLRRDDYLKIVAGAVHFFQKTQLASGKIQDPNNEDSTYATPCYAHAVAVLVASGTDKDPALLQSGLSAMDWSVDWLLDSVAVMEAADAKKETRIHRMGDFYIYPTMLALEQWEKVAPPERVAVWRQKLTAFRPTGFDLYRTASNNWPLVHGAGEWLRAKKGLTDDAYLEWVLETQKHHFTPFGMFMEQGAPFAYDGFGRYFTTGILQRGYAGQHLDFYRDMSWRGALTSLFTQSPFGEMPTGYRSAHHLWNEAQLAATCEIYAANYARAGKMAEAGAFKRAAHLALQTAQRWIRPDGSAYVTKNRFPVAAQWRVANPFSTYNLLAVSMLAAAYTYADDAIAERPAPADVGGFVVQLPEFNVVIANAGGTYVEYMTRGNFKHNPTGLLRVHLRGANPQLGPSDGAVEFPTPNFEVGDASRAFSVGPAWKDADGKEVRLAEFPSLKKFAPSETNPALPPQAQIAFLKQTPEEVSFRASYQLGADQISETLTLNHSGLSVSDEASGPGIKALRLYFPALVFDGLEETQIDIQGASAELCLRGAGVRFAVEEPKGARIERTGAKITQFNGQIEPFFADTNARNVTFSIRALPATLAKP